MKLKSNPLALACLSLACLTVSAVAQSIQPIYSFTNGPTFPLCGLVQGSDGYFYGTTTFTGGTVFQSKTDGTQNTLVSFGSTNGSGPQAGLVLGPDGSYYGTTSAGGAFGEGTIFRVTTNGNLSNIHCFSVTVWNGLTGTNYDGTQPMTGLTVGPDGSLYGTTPYGGSGGSGTIFNVTTNGVFTTLYSFTATAYSSGTGTSGVTNSDGAQPHAGLTFGLDGNLYGTTSAGGTNGDGTVFQGDNQRASGDAGNLCRNQRGGSGSGLNFGAGR